MQLYSGQTRDWSQLMEPRAATSKTLIQTLNACAVKDTCLKRDDGGTPAPKAGQLGAEVDRSKTGSFYRYCFAVVVGSEGTFVAGEVAQNINQSMFLLYMKIAFVLTL